MLLILVYFLSCCFSGLEDKIFRNENDVGSIKLKGAGFLYSPPCETLRVDGGLVCLEKGRTTAKRERRQRHDAIRAATHNRIENRTERRRRK